MPLIHASCVAIAGAGVLIRGPSGAGKSDLALRLIDEGAELVADDYCDVRARGRELLATAAPNLSGKLEVRGLGIVRLPARAEAVVHLVVDLTAETKIERLPDVTECRIEGVNVPWLALDAFNASAPAKVRLALRVHREGLKIAP